MSKLTISDSLQLQVLCAGIEASKDERNGMMGVLRNIVDHDVVVLKFTASWCGPCKQLSELINEDTLAHPDIYRRVFWAEINVDEDFCHDLSEQHRVKSIPLCVIIPADAASEMKAAYVKGCNIEKVRDAISLILSNTS